MSGKLGQQKSMLLQFKNVCRDFNRISGIYTDKDLNDIPGLYDKVFQAEKAMTELNLFTGRILKRY